MPILVSIAIIGGMGLIILLAWFQNYFSHALRSIIRGVEIDREAKSTICNNNTCKETNPEHANYCRRCGTQLRTTVILMKPITPETYGKYKTVVPLNGTDNSKLFAEFLSSNSIS